MNHTTRAPKGHSDEALQQLERDGLLRREQASFRTTKRFQAAMARAAFRLFRTGDAGDDLRLPIAAALFELYGPDHPSNQIAELVDVLLPIELAELNPLKNAIRV